MREGSNPQLLTVTADAGEAGVLRGVLEAQGIHVIVQGETHGGMLPGIASPIELRLLVPEAELERARKILEDARPVLDGTQGDGTDLGDAVCPVHEGKAVATCSRCGTFLCAKCPSLGNPAVCEDCVQRPTEARAQAAWPKRVASVMLGGMALVILVAVALGLARVFLGR
jgi:hypothetical protein